MGEQPPITWLCRRGMKELELPLLRYLNTIYPQSTPAEQQRFRRFLAEPDSLLWQCLYVIPAPTPPEDYQTLVAQILAASASDA
ncbi:MAG: succinate dehydrogenase assembly factor 2 [Methylococcaceae bacterium]